MRRGAALLKLSVVVFSISLAGLFVYWRSGGKIPGVPTLSAARPFSRRPVIRMESGSAWTENGTTPAPSLLRSVDLPPLLAPRVGSGFVRPRTEFMVTSKSGPVVRPQDLNAQTIPESVIRQIMPAEDTIAAPPAMMASSKSGFIFPAPAPSLTAPVQPPPKALPRQTFAIPQEATVGELMRTPLIAPPTTQPAFPTTQP